MSGLFLEPHFSPQHMYIPHVFSDVIISFFSFSSSHIDRLKRVVFLFCVIETLLPTGRYRFIFGLGFVLLFKIFHRHFEAF